MASGYEQHPITATPDGTGRSDSVCLGLARGITPLQTRAIAHQGDSAVLTDVKMVFKLVPMVVTTAIIAIEIPAAIRPYSIAVAPLSSFPNFTRAFFIEPVLRAAHCEHNWHEIFTTKFQGKGQV